MMNPTPTLLPMTLTIVTVTMKYAPNPPKHQALNSLQDMAYCK